MGEKYLPDYTSREGREYVMDHLDSFSGDRLRDIITQWHQEWMRHQKILREYPNWGGDRKM